jgi:hypothetical protein
MDLAHDRDAGTGFGGGEGGALACEAGADDEDIVCGQGWRLYPVALAD